VVLRPGRLGSDGQNAPSSEPVHWTKGELIGAGAFGRVYMGLNNETGQLMAVKQASLQHKRSSSSPVAHVRPEVKWACLKGRASVHGAQ